MAAKNASTICKPVLYSDDRLSGTGHLNTGPFEYWISICWVFKWFRCSDVRYSDPHCNWMWRFWIPILSANQNILFIGCTVIRYLLYSQHLKTGLFNEPDSFCFRFSNGTVVFKRPVIAKMDLLKNRKGWIREISIQWEGMCCRQSAMGLVVLKQFQIFCHQSNSQFYSWLTTAHAYHPLPPV
jgi:hypothetical protein